MSEMLLKAQPARLIIEQILVLADRAELDAPLPAKDTHSEVAGPGPDHGPGAGAVPDLHFPGVGLHGRDGLPESTDNQAEDRLESVRQGLPGLVQINGLRTVRRPFLYNNSPFGTACKFTSCTIINYE